MNQSTALLYWCNEGFESVIDITDMLPDKVMERNLLAKLAGKFQEPNKLDTLIYDMKLRAQLNLNREYEAYIVTLDESISVDNLKEIAETSPQCLVNIAREKGVKVFSNKSTNNRIII